MEKKHLQIHHPLLVLDTPSQLLGMLPTFTPIRLIDHAQTPLHHLWLVSIRHPHRTAVRHHAIYQEVVQLEVPEYQDIDPGRVVKKAMDREEDSQIRQPLLPIWSCPTKVA